MAMGPVDIPPLPSQTPSTIQRVLKGFLVFAASRYPLEALGAFTHKKALAADLRPAVVLRLNKNLMDG
jgi:hypothetical protein